MNLRLLSTAIVLLVAVAASAQPTTHPSPRLTPAKPGDQVLEIGGVQRTYLLHVPKSYDGSAAVPLVVLLHGRAGSSTVVSQYTGFAVKSTQARFILLAPDAEGAPRAWNSGLNMGRGGADDVAYIRALIDHVQKWYRIDPDRIYVTGHSSGAMMTYRLAAEMSDVFAAAAPMAGSIGATLPQGGTVITTQPSQPVSILALHGRADRLVPYRGGPIPGAPNAPAFVSVADSVAFWVKADGITAAPVVEDRRDDKLTITTYSGGRSGTEVRLMSYWENGHAWPGIEATDAIWQFFNDHPKHR